MSQAVGGSCGTLGVSNVADARTCASVARRIAIAGGFGSTAAAEIATCASELATNVVRHGRGGSLRVLCEKGRLTLQATDQGGGSAARLRSLVELIRSQPSHPSSFHGLGVLVRWMDDIEIDDANVSGLDIRASRGLPSPLLRR